MTVAAVFDAGFGCADDLGVEGGFAFDWGCGATFTSDLDATWAVDFAVAVPADPTVASVTTAVTGGCDRATSAD